MLRDGKLGNLQETDMHAQVEAGRAIPKNWSQLTLSSKNTREEEKLLFRPRKIVFGCTQHAEQTNIWIETLQLAAQREIKTIAINWNVRIFIVARVTAVQPEMSE